MPEPKTSETAPPSRMIGYKGFDKDFRCRGKQYEAGQTYEEPKASLCNAGIHFCEHPLNVLEYYPPAGSRFAEVEAENPSNETSNDTKRVTKKLTVKAELTLAGVINAAVKFVFDRATWSGTDKATGYRGAASATGAQGAASATGAESVAVSLGIEGSAKAALGAWIVLAAWSKDIKGNWHRTDVKSVQVDGETIKPDTFYRLEDGAFVEV
jgi:hypothetical protein